MCTNCTQSRAATSKHRKEPVEVVCAPDQEASWTCVQVLDPGHAEELLSLSLFPVDIILSNKQFKFKLGKKKSGLSLR